MTGKRRVRRGAVGERGGKARRLGMCSAVEHSSHDAQAGSTEAERVQQDSNVGEESLNTSSVISQVPQLRTAESPQPELSSSHQSVFAEHSLQEVEALKKRVSELEAANKDL